MESRLNLIEASEEELEEESLACRYEAHQKVDLYAALHRRRVALNYAKEALQDMRFDRDTNRALLETAEKRLGVLVDAINVLRKVCPPWSPEAFERLHDLYDRARKYDP